MINLQLQARDTMRDFTLSQQTWWERESVQTFWFNTKNDRIDEKQSDKMDVDTEDTPVGPFGGVSSTDD